MVHAGVVYLVRRTLEVIDINLVWPRKLLEEGSI
jgi:hypothetical protein